MRLVFMGTPEFAVPTPEAPYACLEPLTGLPGGATGGRLPR